MIVPSIISTPIDTSRVPMTEIEEAAGAGRMSDGEEFSEVQGLRNRGGSKEKRSEDEGLLTKITKEPAGVQES
ncbi:hypothetical protein MJO28_016645 [Puccinia striiformis f. sp. tritici]|uniref:Uncharacterized protein n=4 Tax=Puccinia striiformis TaxID=27350 RepID=A0A0L0V786_9BASI|nr:hypothetical protein Pst134EA_030275 [Puccinia striiformis f. sp. tritici]KNE95133.1 hypothetical protein PSTG_11500 [Puccinia striiformis f. sp. tritici PST-78]POW01353.1 hypothetical protein PSTT_12551 [Puccinia striiformis]KAH9440187.1 hypothetical protein Pst134EB_030815 [Puccinia striiformis f. sp. tritici]KAH9446354.1 hypothetical protein Pst134EA_030275 [Puccinia striiformis f. sp. tritici]KAI7934733.1 hypothetical protein MJO29_015996 [Puccinia striiformis f. sp. tritici]